jgi:uncharacterized membrane protein YeaQ/YmgE (transglycosylase-associated protein family)
LNAWLLHWLNSKFQLATNGLMSSILTALVLGAMLVVMLAETGGTAARKIRPTTDLR